MANKLHYLVAPGRLASVMSAHNPLSARLAELAGFDGVWASGFELSAAYGLPDASLLSFTQHLDMTRAIVERISALVIADLDTGYGNALNVQRTVIEYARAGAAAVMIEDQVSPKKCGHTKGKQVVSREEARMKIRAAVEARAERDILILARTDARAVHGPQEALARCRDFEAEGADIIFYEAPESEAEMEAFCRAVSKPCMANMVAGGRTPLLPPSGLERLGYKLAVYPVMLLSSAISAMQTALRALQPGAVAPVPPSVSFTELQHIVGFPEYWDRETRFRAAE